MLKVYFGQSEESILNIDVYFNNVYQPEWFDDEIVKSIIKDIDQSDVQSAYCIKSPILGQITAEQISGGAKALICLYKCDDISIDLIVCGSNCEPWIVKIAKLRDIEVSMSGYDLTFENEQISGICLNDGTSIYSYKDWIEKMCHYVGE